MSAAGGAREAILAAVRAARPAAVALPDVDAAPRAPAPGTAELVARFAASATAAGARMVETRRASLAAAVAALHPPAARVLSRVGSVASTVAEPSRPHDLASLDLLVCEAGLGVAENGAVWLPASRLGERAALFLATEVVVVLDRHAIVADLHAAYARLDVAAEAFGAFVAGPSKTADIEQSLVVGAQGAMAMIVVLVSA